MLKLIKQMERKLTAAVPLLEAASRIYTDSLGLQTSKSETRIEF